MLEYSPLLTTSRYLSKEEAGSRSPSLYSLYKLKPMNSFLRPKGLLFCIKPITREHFPSSSAGSSSGSKSSGSLSSIKYCGFLGYMSILFLQPPEFDLSQHPLIVDSNRLSPHTSPSSSKSGPMVHSVASS